MADLRASLNELVLATAQATLEAMKSGRLQRVMEEYTFKDVFITEDGSGWSSRTRNETREAWMTHDMAHIAEESKRPLEPLWENCAQQLFSQQAFTPKKDVATVRGDLACLRWEIVRRVTDETTAACVPELVDRLLLEYAGAAHAWNGKLWLSGFRVSEPLELKDGFILRPATNKDLSSEGPTRYLQSAWSFFGLPEIPGSILEVSCSACDRPNLRQTLTALCLFRLCAVELTQEEWQSDSIFPYHGSRSLYLTTPKTRFTHMLTKDEVPSLAAFLQELPDDLPTNPSGHHDNPKWIGLKSYFRALHTATDDEERLGQAVASLEASLLTGEKSEISYRLSLRTASLLRSAGLTPGKVFTEMRTAYNLRSIYAHGGQIGTKDRETARLLCPIIMDYARLAVVKSLQFSSPRERTAILTKLDLALLDEREREDLESRLKGGLWDYAIPSEVRTT